MVSRQRETWETAFSVVSQSQILRKFSVWVKMLQIFFKKAKFTYLILQQEKQKLLIKLAIHIYYISYGGTSNRREHGLAEGSVGKPSARRSQRQSCLGRTIARLNKMVGQELWYMTAHKMVKRHATIFFLILNCTIKLVHLKM